MPRICLAVIASFCLALAVSPKGARAESSAVVVVIEAGGVAMDAERIRRAVGEELEMPAVSVLEATRRPNIGTVAVAMTELGRRAVIGFVPFDGTRFAVMVEVRARAGTSRRGDWLVDPIVSAVRTSLQSRARAAMESSVPEVLDPWIASRVDDADTDGLAGRSAASSRRGRELVSLDEYYLGEEIIDPWAEAIEAYRNEQAERLARPRRGATRSRPSASASAPR